MAEDGSKPTGDADSPASPTAPATAEDGKGGAKPPGYVDEFDPGGDHMPIDREARRDDVRNLGSGSAVGISCMVVVLMLVALFWGVRGCLMR